jgi:TRAP-type mannitol/chloroaromatic compound transport system substrate-binding protein
MKRLVPALLLAAGILALAACEKQQQAGGDGEKAMETINWKMASSFAATTPLIGDAGPYFTERLAQASGGRLQIKFFDPGKLVPGLEVFDAVSKGAVDAGWSSPGYWIGKIPATPLFAAVPFGPDMAEYLAWMYEGGGLQLWQELYAEHNLWVTPCTTIPPEASGWFRTPITSTKQFDGMKIRFFGLGGKVMQKMGASVQLLAGGDIYPALERGVLDATEFSMPSIDEKLGFHQIAKHYYFPGWHQQSSLVELQINLDRWNSLTVMDQTLIEMACKDAILRGMTLGEVQQGPALERIEQSGVTIHTWTPEILAEFRKATEEVFVEEAANNADFARVYESYKNFRESYAKWAKLSRVPVAEN